MSDNKKRSPKRPGSSAREAGPSKKPSKQEGSAGSTKSASLSTVKPTVPGSQGSSGPSASGSQGGGSGEQPRRSNRLRELSCQQKLDLKVDSMLEDEIGWLHNFVPSESDAMMDTDNLLIGGHLRLIRTLLTCEGVDKSEYGKLLIKDLLHDFLFPASLLIMDEPKHIANNNTKPKCGDPASRVAAYDLLIELCDRCLQNLAEMYQQITTMHHDTNTEAGNQWEYMPPVDGKSKAGFVGIKNGGATCYMNSVLQQLYMTPGVKDTILGVDEDGTDEDSVFYQLQQIFGHLLDSKLQYYVPERFWKVFMLWGQTVNIREQQDSLDFYQAVIDQVDEHLKKLGKDSVFKKTFQGTYSDQKICKDCPHRYEREEIFYALNVTVKNATLQDSLAQFVKGELLEGDNAYFCEKCGEKRNTVKRMCIKTLPPVLCIQLKRFGYDWEANRALKFDDHFQFPWVLDMEPYTAEGMSRRDEHVSQTLNTSGSSLPEEADEGMGAGGVETLTISCVPNTPSKQINYCLVGVVVHSGQANAGHYYSFIKDRRGNYMNNPTKGKWYKFNDIDVTEFDMTDTQLEEECFGGTYKAKVYEQSSSSSSYPEERLRYWNGYLLFYERMDTIRTPVSAKKSKMSIRKSLSEKTASMRRNSDSLVELTELVHKGEKKGIFQDKMPAHIERVVREENLRFMKNRDVYSADYFNFVRRLTSVNIEAYMVLV